MYKGAFTIVSLREKVEHIIKREIEKSGSWMRNLSDEERNNVEILAASIVNKIIHDPSILPPLPVSHGFII